MSKKWYNYIVSIDEDAAQQAQNPSGATSATKSAAQSVAEIAATISPEPQFTTPVTDPTSFEEIYKAAEIPDPPQGYSILKVADMLQSDHIRTMPMDVKRSSVLVALDAAGVDIKDVIQDAVRRDRALDTFERVQEKSVTELEARKSQENGQVQAEIEEGAWYVLPAEPADAFAAEPERLWQVVLRRAGGTLALVATYPDDPADN